MMVATVLERMMSYFGPDVRRINHALKVYALAGFIGRCENLSAPELLGLELAAILHDIGIKEAERKYHSSRGAYQEQEGPPVARTLLAGLPLDRDLLARILFLIGNHHSYQKIDGSDFQILVEADFLVNIFEDQLSVNMVESVCSKYFRTATGTSLLQRMFLPEASGEHSRALLPNET